MQLDCNTFTVKPQMLAPAGGSLHKSRECEKSFSHRRYLKDDMQ